MSFAFSDASPPSGRDDPGRRDAPLVVPLPDGATFGTVRRLAVLDLVRRLAGRPVFRSTLAMRVAMHLPVLAAREAVERELRYCSHGPGMRLAGGLVGRAQDFALKRGWLTAAPGRLLAITEAGRATLATLSGRAGALALAAAVSLCQAL